MAAHQQESFDVLIVGSGLTGCMAAIEAAEAGVRVALASTGPIFSGSSFFEGTWGLGCVAADGPDDEEDLVATILDVGCGMADEQLARTLVHDTPPALADLEARGVALRMPDAAAEREYIPCFDHANRIWRGLERASLKAVLTRELERLQVALLGRCTLIDLIEEGQERIGEMGEPHTRVAGAVLHDAASDTVRIISAPAVVLATGGMGGLYANHLTRDDVVGSAQAVALSHGEELVNSEFLQIMPTVLTPKGPAVFNEKCFRFSTLSIPVDRELLDERSTYGPFTSRLASCAVDLAVARSAGPVTVAVDRLPANVPEFIETYRSWYQTATGLDIAEPVPLVYFAHASNGGIRIDTDASCRLPGLFAAGECTGGMHGADRIGGLASASALVFGRRAGRSAAAYAKLASRSVGCPLACDSIAHAMANDLPVHQLDERALILRTEEGLASAEAELEERMCAPGTSLLDRQRSISAHAMVKAMRARTQSLGSHFRADAPAV